MSRWFAGMILVLAAFAVTSAIAVADTVKVATTISVELKGSATGDSIGGKVSAKKGCQKARDVTVRYIDQSAGINRKLGTDTTDRRGNYSVPYGGFAPPGTFKATTPRSVIRKGDDKIVCKLGSGTLQR